MNSTNSRPQGWRDFLGTARGAAVPTILASILAVGSFLGNIWQFTETQELNQQKQDFEQSLEVSNARERLYLFRTMAINEMVIQIDAVSTQTQQVPANLNSADALRIRRGCEAADALRQRSLREISDRERDFQGRLDPAYELTPAETLERLGRPDCWESVRAILGAAIKQLRNDSDPRLETVLRFVVPLRDRCSFGRFPWLISQALSVTYMAGERRLYLERNCRLPESPAHSRRRNREGPASSKGLNSQRGFGPAVEPRRKSRPRSTSLHGSSPCKCQRLSTLRWDRLPPSRPSTKSGARAGGRRLSDRRLHRWLAGTSASAPSSHGAADLLGLNRAHICVRNPFC